LQASPECGAIVLADEPQAPTFEVTEASGPSVRLLLLKSFGREITTQA